MPVWDAIYSPREVLSRYNSPWPVNPGVPVINFISRLSDNQRTRYEEFFEAVRILEERGTIFEVWVQNPNEAKEIAWCFEQGDSVKVVGNTGRRDYLRSLWGSDIVPILYSPDFIYSLGFCEAITARNMVLTYDCEAWPAHQILQPYAPTPEVIADCLAEMILEYHRSTKWLVKLEKQEQWLIENRSVERNIYKVRNTIEEVVGVGKAHA